MSPIALAAGPGAQPDPALLFDNRTVRFWCRALIASYVALLFALWLKGFTPFEDFSVFAAAGRLAASGHAGAAYDWQSIRQLQPGGAGAVAFFYPPTFLLLLVPLGFLPFTLALALWLAGSLAAFSAAIRAILPGSTTLLAACAAPTTLLNLLTGQNGLLMAAVLGGALANLDARPLLAGLLIGLSACKPQFGLLLPAFLAVTGRWRVFAAAAASLGGLLAAAAALLGWQAFAEFSGALPAAHDAFLRHAQYRGVMEWDHLASIYGMLRAVGLGAVASWSGHVALAGAAIGGALWLAVRGAAGEGVAAAALVTATVVATPYSEVNDLALLMVPMAFLVRDGLTFGFRAWEPPALAAAFALPLAVPAFWAVLRWAGLVGVGSLVGIGPAMCAVLAAVIAGRLGSGRGR